MPQLGPARRLEAKMIDESVIPEGRICRGELEYRLGFANAVKLPDSLTAAALATTAHELEWFFRRTCASIEASHSEWCHYAFNTSGDAPSGSHSGSTIGKLWLHEAGRLRSGAMQGPLDESALVKAREDLLQYKADFRGAMDRLESKVENLQEMLRMELVSLRNSEREDFGIKRLFDGQDTNDDDDSHLLAKLTELCQNAHLVYNEMLDVILTHLSGRPFLRRR